MAKTKKESIPVSDKVWMFTRACNYAPEKTFLLSFKEDRSNIPQDITQILIFKPNGLAHAMITWQAIGIAAVTKPQVSIVIVGAVGNVWEASNGMSESVIDKSDEGPASRGILRDVRCIGDHAYACGMKRQVYRREANGKWTRFDKGTLSPLESGEITGFNSIDGFSEDDIYAVGWGGEIWHCIKGKWQQEKSPTKLKLERVVCAADGYVYAVGQCGIIIRGKNNHWEIIEQKETDQQFWGAVWYWNRLWLATTEAVFTLNKKNKLEKVQITPNNEPITCGWLDANFDQMWSVGAKHLFKTTDGKCWEQVFTEEQKK